MKINDPLKKTTGLPVAPTQTGAGKGAAKAEAASAGSTGSTPAVNVQLSSQAQVLASQVSSASVFDTAKVEEIKAAIASGTFQVDAEKVAEGLMDTVRDLIQSRKASA